MADEPLLNKPKRVRKPRRNFQKELDAIRQFCEIKIEVLRGLQPKSVNRTHIDLTDAIQATKDSMPNPHMAGQIEALEGVLAKIGAQ